MTTTAINGGAPGLVAGTKRVLFCGGMRECARRLEQIARGRLRVQPVPPVSRSTKSQRFR